MPLWQESMLELFWGSLSRHQYYLTRADQPASRSDQPASRTDQPASRNDQPASRSDQLASRSPQLVPYFPHYSHRDLVWDQLIRAADGSGAAMRQSAATLRLVKNGRLEATLPVKLSSYTLPILSHLGMLTHDYSAIINVLS